MRIRTDYEMDLRDWNLEHGTDMFKEYKTTADDERKAYLEDELFKIVRRRNEIPLVRLSEIDGRKELMKLSETDSHRIYHDGCYGLNPVGVTFLNRFFPSLMDVEKEGRPSVRETFYRDDKLRKVCRKCLTMGEGIRGLYRYFPLSASCGYCSNFRPATAKAIYELNGKPSDCHVLDTSSGFGGRLLGAHFASNVSEYVGIDPNTAEQCADLIEYLKQPDFDTHTSEIVYKMGSEDFTPEAFPQYQNHFDLSFTSPPYFNVERYSRDETQSYKKFPTWAGWVTGFYQATIDNTCSALKMDGVFSINIFEKIGNIKELTKLFLANNGWYVTREDRYLLQVTPGIIKDEDGNLVTRERDIQNHFEPVWFARHATWLYDHGEIDRDTLKQFRERATKDSRDWGASQHGG